MTDYIVHEDLKKSMHKVYVRILIVQIFIIVFLIQIAGFYWNDSAKQIDLNNQLIQNNKELIESNKVILDRNKEIVLEDRKIISRLVIDVDALKNKK